MNERFGTNKFEEPQPSLERMNEVNNNILNRLICGL